MKVKYRYVNACILIPLNLAYQIKADMNSDIPLQTTAIFFSNELLSETEYWLGVCYG